MSSNGKFCFRCSLDLLKDGPAPWSIYEPWPNLKDRSPCWMGSKSNRCRCWRRKHSWSSAVVSCHRPSKVCLKQSKAKQRIVRILSFFNLISQKLWIWSISILTCDDFDCLSQRILLMRRFIRHRFVTLTLSWLLKRGSQRRAVFVSEFLARGSWHIVLICVHWWEKIFNLK